MRKGVIKPFKKAIFVFMAGNTFGRIFQLTTFGESHGMAIGGIIDGCPVGLKLDFDFIQKELDRRRPGQSKLTTQRKESDRVEFLSGIFKGETTGTPIGFQIQNEDQKSKDYSHIKINFVLLTPTLPTRRNMATEIIEVEEGLLQERLLVE